MHTQQGVTLIEVLIGTTILVIVSSALFLAYSNTLDIVTASQYHSAASNIIESEIELIRNMNYGDIGTIGGVPTGKLLASRSVTLDQTAFVVKTFVRNIDDPFDGILGGNPNDTTPADYKLVEIRIECPTCPRFGLILSTTTVAPRSLESADGSGNLFIQVLDADGLALAGANVTVVNNVVSPVINLTDTTGADGMLQLVGVPTSSAGYEITVSKTGHSTERTYPPGEPSNPNPIKPHSTVTEEQITTSTFAIDLTSTMTVRTVDELCSPINGMDLLMSGGKLIGTSPNVLKYSLSHTTATDGTVTISNLEWDSYTLQPTDTVYDIAGVNSSSPLTLDPNRSVTVDWVVVPISTSSLLVTVRDNLGQPVNEASVRLNAGAYDTTLTSGQYRWSQTDWSGGQFAQQSGGIYTASAGMLTLAPDGGPYATNSYEWLESNTVDFGTSSTSFFTIAWNPTEQPPLSGTDSLRLQLAANNDTTTWNYVGPDGTSNTYFASSSASLPGVLLGNRYLRYRVEMRTLDTNTTPRLEDITLVYRAGCLPSGAAHFNGLNTGTYTLTVTKAGFQNYTDTDVSVSADWQEYLTTLTP